MSAARAAPGLGTRGTDRDFSENDDNRPDSPPPAIRQARPPALWRWMAITAARWRRQGAPLAQIAARFGCTVETVERLLAERRP